MEGKMFERKWSVSEEWFREIKWKYKKWKKNDIIVDINDLSFIDKYRSDCFSWVIEKINFGLDLRIRNLEKLKDFYWEENRNENLGNFWIKNFGLGWMFSCGRGGYGKGVYRGNFVCSD